MIVVTTPTGQIGGTLLRSLLDAGERVRVVVRDAARLADDVRDGVELVHGSHGDAAIIDRALDGADAMFWCVPPTPIGTMEEAYSGFSRPAAEAAARHGTPRIVIVSALGRGTPWEDRAGLVTASLRMVNLFRETAASVRSLAMPGFMENMLMQLEAIRAGHIFGPIDPNKKLPYTATRDMANVAFQLLMDRSWAGDEDVPVLGPEDLSGSDMAAIVSELVGREVSYVYMPPTEFAQQLAGRGMPSDFVQGYVEMMRAKNEGMDNIVSRTSATTGSTTFRTWAQEVLGPALAL